MLKTFFLSLTYSLLSNLFHISHILQLTTPPHAKTFSRTGYEKRQTEGSFI